MKHGIKEGAPKQSWKNAHQQGMEIAWEMLQPLPHDSLERKPFLDLVKKTDLPKCICICSRAF